MEAIDMHASPAALFHDWHDFYLILGAAGATLVGLMFVAASIGATIFSKDHLAPMRAFITPSVVHFGAVLFASLTITVPTHTWRSLAALLGAGALAGSIYCTRISLEVVIRRKFNVDWSDRLFYAIIPLVGYLLGLIAAALLLAQSAASPNVIAAALLTLLLAGIRNAWDMTVWAVVRSPTTGDPSP